MIKCALDTIVDDMAYAVMRTARSSIVRDVLDYSVTLCDRDGRILSQAKTVALHLGAVPDAIDVVLAKFAGALAPGDVVILNDPYEGGMHLPDIFMFKPIFHAGRLQGFSVVIAHHCDVGGRVPGSNASDSTEIFQEGLRIPPMKLYARGEPNETLLAIIARNVRLPDLVLGDLEAQLATCNIGERELLRLIERYGEDELYATFDRLIDYGEELTRKAIRAWPDGTYRFTDYIDGDGFSPEPIPICCAITVADDHLTVDFAGSSPQVKGAINSTLSFTKSSTYLTIRCALDRDVPNNAGIYRCITVTAPEGSILNPQMPAPVAARALTGYRVVDTVMGALAQIVPEKVMAAGEGGNTVVALGGYDGAAREPFILVDMINGAWGGAPRQGRHRGRDQPLAEHVEPAHRDARGPLPDPDGGLRLSRGFLRPRQVSRRARARAPVPAARRVRRPAAARRPPRAPALRPLRRRARRILTQPAGGRRRMAHAARQGHARRRPRHGAAARAGGRRRLRRPARARVGPHRRGSRERQDFAGARRGCVRRRLQGQRRDRRRRNTGTAQQAAADTQRNQEGA